MKCLECNEVFTLPIAPSAIPLIIAVIAVVSSLGMYFVWMLYSKGVFDPDIVPPPMDLFGAAPSGWEKRVERSQSEGSIMHGGWLKEGTSDVAVLFEMGRPRTLKELRDSVGGNVFGMAKGGIIPVSFSLESDDESITFGMVGNSIRESRPVYHKNYFIVVKNGAYSLQFTTPTKDYLPDLGEWNLRNGTLDKQSESIEELEDLKLKFETGMDSLKQIAELVRSERKAKQ